MQYYTYDDWSNGLIETEELVKLFQKGKLGSEELRKIHDKQDEAFKDKITYEILWRVGFFMSRYNKIHPKIKYVEREIEHSNKRINDFIQSYPEAYNMALVGEDGRRELSVKDVEAIYEGAYRDTLDFTTPFAIIVELEYYQWLLWFQNEAIKDKGITYEVYYENADFYQSIYVNEERNGNKTYVQTWSNLFKDPKQSDTIISLLKVEGYISESCTWLQFPEQLTMIALYLTLSRRGYLRNIPFSAQALSNAFNAQFNMNFGSKQWSPSKRNVAEQYLDLFNLIPWLK